MKTAFLTLVAATSLLASAQAATARTGSQPKPGPGIFFVSTNGSDQWSGRLAAPDRKGTDGPFATLAAALKATRAKPAETTRPSSIHLGGGLYCLWEPLVLTPQDSGLTIAAYPGTQPVLSGGRRITGWKETTVGGKRLWVAAVREARNGRWAFRELPELVPHRRCSTGSSARMGRTG